MSLLGAQAHPLQCQEHLPGNPRPKLGMEEPYCLLAPAARGPELPQGLLTPL